MNGFDTEATMGRPVGSIRVAWNPESQRGRVLGVHSVSRTAPVGPALGAFVEFSEGLWEDKFAEPPKTELLAISAPSDEASLAISTASAAVWASDSLSAGGFKTFSRISAAALAVLGVALV